MLAAYNKICERANDVCGKISGKLVLRNDLEGKANYLPRLSKMMIIYYEMMIIYYEVDLFQGETHYYGGSIVFTFKILQKIFRYLAATKRLV